MWHSYQGPHPQCTMDVGYPMEMECMDTPLDEFGRIYKAAGSSSARSVDGGPYRNKKSSIQPTKHLEETHLGTYSRRCTPQSPPFHRRPLLNFPPPPKYPPPHPVREDCCTIHTPTLALRNLDLGPGVPGPSGLGSNQVLDRTPRPHYHHHRGRPGERPEEEWEPEAYIQDYSYAYYEPGPPKRHSNVPRHPITGSCYDNRTRKHTYITRYGTEENIYEEISDIERARRSNQHSMLSLSQSLVEEEVRRVKSRHKRILGELNLSVEAMLMPQPEEQTTKEDPSDRLTDLLTVGPTDELLSPAPLDLDSGFSGSSSGASYHSGAGSLRRPQDKRIVSKDTYQDRKISKDKSDTKSESGSSTKSFWSRKGWRKIGLGLVGKGNG